jgi:hypothetical protein
MPPPADSQNRDFDPPVPSPWATRRALGSSRNSRDLREARKDEALAVLASPSCRAPRMSWATAAAHLMVTVGKRASAAVAKVDLSSTPLTRRA